MIEGFRVRFDWFVHGSKVKRNSWGYSYSLVRGEILGFMEDECAKAFTKDVFINQERKLGDRRGLDTLVVLAINDTD